MTGLPPTNPPLHHLFHPDNSDAYASAIRTSLDRLLVQLDSVRGPVTGLAPDLAERPVREIDLDEPLGDSGAALDEACKLWLNDAVWFHEPTYAAHLNCPVVIPALMGELLMAAVNTSVDTFDQSVGGTFMERHLIDWTAQRIGFSTGADGIFTSGGTQSNLQAMLLARAEATARGATLGQLRILVSEDSHFSLRTAARLLGLPPAAVVEVPVDEARRMDARELRRALEQCADRGEVPMAVVATAGTTDFGAIDPIEALAALSRSHDAWLHVDAAYGGGLLASRRRRPLLAGIEQADSVTIDFHKTWFQPVSSSALIVREGRMLGHATWHADYLNPRGAAMPNQVDKSLQTTRRFDAIKLWLTLRVMGADAIGDYFDAVIDLAHEVYDQARAFEDIEFAAPPRLSTLVFRYTGRHGNQEEDQLNRTIRSTLFSRGTAVVAATKVDGRQFLKLTLLNPKATLADIAGIIEQIREVGAELDGALVGAAPRGPLA
ncbi:aspartate aminotransferase family protein [Hoyosella sp. G463]|uniref:Aspartate aminotransferase family protein n=1 Tax=Lolliginicoccus lacisalsi TaxID=2742202 RepID=A0A927J9L5_9ACTN|nr:aspartate aminotransferase family protein [Lolliginicoccus lacisalsi]MBD8504885.1 aspartate aminotransferase family protein [Lolliginicoccus lacisalsi]